jgi:hypothetical protein
MCLRSLRVHAADGRLFVGAPRQALSGREAAAVTATLRRLLGASAAGVCTGWGGMHTEDAFAWFALLRCPTTADALAASLRSELIPA